MNFIFLKDFICDKIYKLSDKMKISISFLSFGAKRSVAWNLYYPHRLYRCTQIFMFT